MINLEKINFAFQTHIFDFQLIFDGEVTYDEFGLRTRRVTDPYHPDFDPSFNEIVFVHNEAEAQGFPDNVIVAWPRDNIATQLVVNMMNRMVNRTAEQLPNPNSWWGREPISLEDFGLTSPITIEDLVDNWEGVVGVWSSLTDSEQMSLRP